MIKTIKAIYRFVIPKPVRQILRPIIHLRRTVVENYLIKTQPKRHRKALEIVRKKDKFKVAFFLIHSSIWKYEGVYRLMDEDDCFDPIVVVCPYIAYDEETMLRDMNQAYENFKNKGYNVIKTFNKETGVWLDVKKEIRPDIVFFTNPHNLTKKEYYITNYLDNLTCYVPYGITHTHLQKMQYNQFFHNVLWKYFLETELHKEMSIKYSDCGGINAIVSGYPGIDAFFDKNYKPKDPWKIKNRKLKRIIWAPHHTLDEDKSFLSYSNLLRLKNDMFDVAKEFKGEIQIAFKPHPLLKTKLYIEPNWGREKTDNYYKKWNDLTNGQLNESDYVDLFLTSDAMILDSGSFLNEYLCVNKPSLYIMRDENLTDRFNDFGKMAFKFHYHGANKHDIENFIEHIVIKENDVLKMERELFINKYLIPANKHSASENIYSHILKQILN